MKVGTMVELNDGGSCQCGVLGAWVESPGGGNLVAAVVAANGVRRQIEAA